MPYSVYHDKKQHSEINIVNLRLLISMKIYHLWKYEGSKHALDKEG